jgi:aspartyl-tRNA(Asn)/glutamyl-tRNA(Gln) amidotransferase subunit B
MARRVFAEAARTGADPAQIVAERGWFQLSDRDELLPLVERVLAEASEQAERYRAGEARLLDFFVGRVLRLSGGRAHPQRVAELLRQALGPRASPPQ